MCPDLAMVYVLNLIHYGACSFWLPVCCKQLVYVLIQPMLQHADKIISISLLSLWSMPHQTLSDVDGKKLGVSLESGHSPCQNGMAHCTLPLSKEKWHGHSSSLSCHTSTSTWTDKIISISLLSLRSMPHQTFRSNLISNASQANIKLWRAVVTVVIHTADSTEHNWAKIFSEQIRGQRQ